MTTSPTTTPLIVHGYEWKIKDTDDNGKVTMHCWTKDKDSNTHLLRFHDFPAFCYIELPLFVGHRRQNWTQYKAQQVFETISKRLGDARPFKFYFKYSEKLYYYRGGKKYPMLFVMFNTLKDMYKCKNVLNKPFKVQNIGTIACKVWETDISLVRKLLTIKKTEFSQWFSIQGIKVTGDQKISKLDNEYIVDRKTMIPIPSEETSSWVSHPSILSFDIETYSDKPNSMPDPYVSSHTAYMISCVYQEKGDPLTRKTDIILYGDCNPSNLKNVNIIRVKSEIEGIDKFTEIVNERDPDVITGYNIFAYDNPFLDTRLKRKLRSWKSMSRLLDQETTLTSFSWGSSGYGHNEINILEMDGRIMIDLFPIIKRDYKLKLYNLKFVSTYFLGRTKHPVTPREMFESYELGKLSEKTPEKTMKQHVIEDYEIKYQKEIIEKEARIRQRIIETGVGTFTDDDKREMLEETKLIVKHEVFSLYHVLCHMKLTEEKEPILDFDSIPENLTVKDHSMEEMRKVVDYCVVDSDLVLDIFNKIHCWIALVAMSNVVGVTIVELFTRGQQIRALSQIYNEASPQNIVIDKRTVPRMEYSGGFVYKPIPGIYKYIPCLDFKSLYPTVMIANNIGHRTFVPPELYDKVSDDHCHIIEWDEEVTKPEPEVEIIDENDENEGDSADPPKKKKKKKKDLETETVHYKFKFIKKEYLEGILPRLLTRLIAERDAVRKVQETLDKNSVEWIVLEQRQLSIKISANSLYGMLGAQNGGKLALPEAAASITAKSRESIKLVNSSLREQGHSIVYGDSVTGDTPILCRAIYPNGESKIFYRPISKIHDDNQEWINGNDGKEYMIKPKELEVWSDKGFTKIKHIMRHRTRKRLYRITAHTGIIKVTEDHSLLDLNGDEISPNEIKVGGQLLTKALPSIPDEGIEIPHAWAWGIFYGDGSCGSYDCPSGYKRSWAINNQNLDYLNKAKTLLEQAYPKMTFKILETMESSGVYKLVPKGDVKSIVNEWREMFYDHPSKYKKVPDIIWKCSLKTREAFYDGYYAADGDKDKNKYKRFDNKGQIGAAGLFLLSRSLGYKVSCNTRKDKMDIYRMTLTKNSQRKKPGVIKKIEDLGYVDDYVYDLETENHHFSAGVGELVVHNTDSSMPDIGIKDPRNAYAKAKKVAEELSKLFPKPMLVEDEEVYHTMLCIKPKMYICIKMNKDGSRVEGEKGMKFKGVLVARRDNCKYQRDSYTGVSMKVLYEHPMMETYNYIIDLCLKLMTKQVSWKDLVVVKGLGSHYKSKSYCMKVFSDELCKIGKPKTPGERLEYVIVKTYGHEGHQLLGYKMRLPSTYLERLKSKTPEFIDYEYYMEKLMMNGIQKQLFQIGYNKELAKLAEAFLEKDKNSVITAMKDKGYSVVVDHLMESYKNDTAKVIDHILGTKLKPVINKFVSYYIKKRKRIDTRIHGEPIKMMVKLIQAKNDYLQEIKDFSGFENIQKIFKVDKFDSIKKNSKTQLHQANINDWIKKKVIKLRIIK